MTRPPLLPHDAPPEHRRMNIAAREHDRERDAARQVDAVRADLAIADAAGWAAACPDLPDNVRRAGREGRDVRAAIAAWLRERLESATAPMVASVGGFIAARWANPHPRTGVPTPAAYQLHDHMVELEATSNWLPAAMPDPWPDIAVEVGPISRFDVIVDGDPPAHYWRTGVLVTVSHPWIPNGSIEILAIAEPAPEEA